MKITAGRIKAVVALECGLTIEDIDDTCRARRVSWPRQIAMVLCTELLPNASLLWIGKRFSRDHTTIIHAKLAVAERMQPAMAELIERCRVRIMSGEPVSVPHRTAVVEPEPIPEPIRPPTVPLFIAPLPVSAAVTPSTFIAPPTLAARMSGSARVRTYNGWTT